MNNMNKSLLLSSFCILCLAGAAVLAETTFSDQTDLQDKQKYTPGMKIGGISLDESEFYEIPTEKCKASSAGTIEGKYFLTNRVYIFKTPEGYGVADIEPSFKDLETGVRRESMSNNPACRLIEGTTIEGELDCNGARMVKRVPYEGCAYDIKVWGHGLSERQAFELVHKRLQVQFIDYREKCIPAKPEKTLQDRVKVF